MKKFRISLFLTSIFMAATGFLFTAKPAFAAIDGFVKVTSPSGGETFTEGDSANITWDSSNNIDKVAIMYKSDAHHGNWVAFTYPNTGSYSWTVDVGNTTNTQFYIEITGYETGKGSTTNAGGYFTVYQKDSTPSPPPPSTPSPTPGTASPTSFTLPTPLPQSEIDRIGEIGRQNYLKYSQPQAGSTAPQTLQFITWSSLFYFEGSLTTDLSKIDDPTKVENFTLDTKMNWTCTFTETLDLTDLEKIKMLQNIDDYWVVEYWFIWIKIEWWEVFEVPAEITYKNENLTTFEPTLKLTETKEEAKIEVVDTKPGEVKAAVTGGGKIEIAPRVEFLGDDQISTNKTAITLTAKSSHNNLDYQLKINSQEQSIEVKDFNEESGEFTLEAKDLVKGANFVELFYKQKDEENFHKADDKTIYVRSKFLLYFLIICIASLTIIILLIAGIFLEKRFLLSAKASKLMANIAKRLKKKK